MLFDSAKTVNSKPHQVSTLLKYSIWNASDVIQYGLLFTTFTPSFLKSEGNLHFA